MIVKLAGVGLSHSELADFAYFNSRSQGAETSEPIVKSLNKKLGKK